MFLRGLFRRWYVDGRLFFHVIINKNSTENGILELRQIDPTKIRKVKEVDKVLETIERPNPKVRV